MSRKSENSYRWNILHKSFSCLKVLKSWNFHFLVSSAFVRPCLPAYPLALVFSLPPHITRQPALCDISRSPVVPVTVAPEPAGSLRSVIGPVSEARLLPKQQRFRQQASQVGPRYVAHAPRWLSGRLNASLLPLPVCSWHECTPGGLLTQTWAAYNAFPPPS